MSPSFRRSLLPLLALNLTASWLGAASSPSLTASAWESASTFRSNEAYAQFNQAKSKKDANLREITLGLASSLIGVQPKTTDNIDEAARLCEQLVKEKPDDTVGLLATYLLARIEQIHRQPMNPKKAEEIYRQLLQQYPESLAAQLSIAKLATLTLFGNNADAAQQKKILGELDNILPKVTRPESRRDTFIVMGTACLLHNLSDEKALRYFIEAEALQTENTKGKANLLIQIGSIAQRMNRKDVALKYYAKFVDIYKRDTRNYLVRQKIVELK